METLGSKTGNGAFKVERDGDKFFVTIENGSRRLYENAAIAYDDCYERYQHLTSTMRGFSYLNACFELEPFVADARKSDMSAYSNLFEEQKALTSMRGWIKRKRAKGIEPNADDVRGRIKENWPTLNDAQIERVENDPKIA